MIDKGTMKKYFTIYENNQTIESVKTKTKAMEIVKAIKKSNDFLGLEQKHYTIK